MMKKSAVCAVITLLLSTSVLLTKLPCDSGTVLWIQPFGHVDHGGGNAFFHNGIDFGMENGGQFFSSAGGTVKEVVLNTGVGWPGTNYRITIQVNTDIILDYHFEIGGSAPLSAREANIFVEAGDTVTAGQHIANLIYGDDLNAADVAHVHWGVYGNNDPTTCPLDYFSPDTAASFETLYDSGLEKRPAYRVDLCE